MTKLIIYKETGILYNSIRYVERDTSLKFDKSKKTADG